MPYPFPKPYFQEPGGPWVVETQRGVKIYGDTEEAWSAYYFAKLLYEKNQDQTS